MMRNLGSMADKRGRQKRKPGERTEPRRIVRAFVSQGLSFLTSPVLEITADGVMSLLSLSPDGHLQFFTPFCEARFDKKTVMRIDYEEEPAKAKPAP